MEGDDFKTEAERLVQEMNNKQINTVPPERRLQYTDLKRIAKYIPSSIFDTDDCSIWKGYISSTSKTPDKGNYVNFYFRKRKVALQRLLYENFVGEITKNEYLRFVCDNRGKCCNINHIKKVEYTTDRSKVKKKKTKQKLELSVEFD